MLDEENVTAISKEGSFYQFKEQESNLPEDNIYYIGEAYSASYLLTRRFKQALGVRLITSSDEITLSINDSPASDGSTVNVSAKYTTLTICFKPTSLDIEKERSVEIFVSVQSVPSYLGKYPEESLFKKTFKVKEKLINKPKIEGKIYKVLPTSMKLGQKAEVIFLFTNSGDRPVHEISIEVKQVEV